MKNNMQNDILLAQLLQQEDYPQSLTANEQAQLLAEYTHLRNEIDQNNILAFQIQTGILLFFSLLLGVVFSKDGTEPFMKIILLYIIPFSYRDSALTASTK